MSRDHGIAIEIKFKDDDNVYRFVNDEDVLAVISDPAQITTYV